MSIAKVKKEQEKPILLQFSLDENCVCLFNDKYSDSNTVGNDVDKKQSFQLLASSRYSFIGCWLHMVSLSNNYSSESFPNLIIQSSKKKLLFVYRDSLSAEDFSRLSQAIRKLKISS